ncbi:hypothetical protein BS50DRAFT_665880 [Corynespora cassiicola Philippines]|uniref:Uncharacterized protein n=1 Tax=Corynespora cassiicola Philippines TaxID=1448308 RepID=A0A2T2NS93_CORCC|nr:hypothetical protein BS50DRAFT_665880 [Corynespora cassiicola Philippines]
MTSKSKAVPSARWTSYEGWDYDGMKERLLLFMESINKLVLLQHVEKISGQTAKMSDPFSAGHHWCCFEFLLQDKSLIIARMRLPRHPDRSNSMTEASELYEIQCEVETMRFLQFNVKFVPTPKLYAYEPSGSPQAMAVGACYMLIEGFYGNTLQDVVFNMCNLPMSIQEHIISQWTAVQAELATFTFNQIGSISHFSKDGNIATIGPLAAAEAENFPSNGPFKTSEQYFEAVGSARLQSVRNITSESGDLGNSYKLCVLGAFVFCDIVSNTQLFKNEDLSFHLNHMDMGTQNILVDDDYNFLAIIDWQFAQTAPVQVNHYPMPFPLVKSDASMQKILQDPANKGFRNFQKSDRAQKLYLKKFKDAESNLKKKGSPVIPSISDQLNGPASRIYAILDKLDPSWPGLDELIYEMLRLAFELEEDTAKNYIERLEAEMEREGNQLC